MACETSDFGATPPWKRLLVTRSASWYCATVSLSSFFSASADRSFEVVDGELGLEREKDVLVVGCGGLCLFARCVDGAPDAAEEIDLPAQVEGQLEVAEAVVGRWLP